MRTDELNVKVKSRLGNKSKKFLAKLLYPSRNSYILFNVSNRAKSKRVNLNYWSESENLGDLLSPVIVDYMLAQKGISRNVEVSQRRHFYSIGSILTAGQQDATVWGSGILNASLTYRLENRKLDIRSVRGPLTRVVLMDYGYSVPEVYGDPAILLPEVYHPSVGRPKFRLGVVLHKDDSFHQKISSAHCINISIRTSDYKDFVNQLVNAEMIVSSSLHGIILAEAYGVKAILLRPQVDMFKYYDYYYSTGRQTFPIADTPEEALNMTPAELPDFTGIRKQLKEAFPFDLFNEKRNL